MKNMELKEKLVALRKEKGLTQLAVAEKLDVSRQAISRWESGITLPSTDNLKSLSALYGVPVDYLLNSDADSALTGGCSEALGYAGYAFEAKYITKNYPNLSLPVSGPSYTWDV